jgi:hypothetical protein
MFEADGNFKVRYTKTEVDGVPTGNLKRRIECAFRIQQRITDSYSKNDYGPIFDQIAAF